MPSSLLFYSSLRKLVAASLLVLTPAAVAQAQTTFSYSGAAQTYTVPAGVTKIQVAADGAAGGIYGDVSNTAVGAHVVANLTVVPGEVLTVRVGGQGASGSGGTQAGGFNGGGNGAQAGAGGGATDLRRATGTGDYSTARNALLVAAGGAGSALDRRYGGGGGNPNGGGGDPGGNGGGGGGGGGGGSGTAGQGASQGGAGGGATSGSSSQGGAGTSQGGGGGGGYYGGGGGQRAGGGGGSSWVTATGSSSISYGGAPAGNGLLTITPLLPPAITSFAPNPGRPGQAVTITGTSLTGATSLQVNGVTANTATFLNNTGTSLTFRVPATATASGTTTLTTNVGTATSAALALSPIVPPGNALAFDGVDDYVSFGSTPVVNNLGVGNFTLEAWVYYNGGTGVESIIRKDGDYNFYINSNKLHAEVWPGGTGNPSFQRFDGTTTTLPANRWTHVAAVWNGSTMQLFVNGVPEPSTLFTTSISASGNLTLGKSPTYTDLLNGRLDEVRIYTAALTAANIQADMRGTTSAAPASLGLYLNFEQGTPGGTNAGQTTLYDQTDNAYNSTLVNFALTGTSSNYVESYALVVPTATAATAIASGTFTANWTASAVGTVDNGYRVDVSTVPTFASVVAGSPFTQGTGTSLAITGLAGGTYYYRVWADKTTVTGQGAYSNTIAVLVPSAPISCAARANNALSFDGSSDYVHSTGTLPATGELTLETWVNPTALAASFSGLLLSDDFAGGAMHWQFSNNVLRFTVNGNSPSDQNGSFTVPTGAWTHVAVVYSASAKTAKFYLNGVLQNTTTYTTTVAAAAQAYSVGGWLSGGAPQRFLNGSLNELRVWNVARTDAQITAGYSQALAAQAGLAVLYSFDQGAAGGSNAGLTTLADGSGTGRTGTLNTFALTGATSNWVAGNLLSYPLSITGVSPVSGPAGTVVTLTGNGFTGATGVSFNGTAAASFTVVSMTSITATVPAGATSGPISVTSSCGTATSVSYGVCALPQAVAQSAIVVLDGSGNATLAASAVNNGSTANCGFATGGGLSVSPSTFSCANVTLPSPALAFNGTTQYVQGTHSLLPLGNTARTIEAWVYPTAAASNGVIFNYGTPTNNLRSGLIMSAGNLYYVGENNDLRGNIALTVNAWNHVAATYNGTTLTLYVNGVLDVQSNPSAFNTTGTTWRIAQRAAPQTGEFLTGRVDEVRVWNVARTATQLSTTRQLVLPGTTPGLVAYYRLNEGSGATTADATGSGNAGTLFNSPGWITPGAPVANGTAVTLTVTDAYGNTSTAATTVAVFDNTGPAGPGLGPLPAAPLLATSNVPEAAGYGVLYQLDVPNATNFNSLAAVPYTVNNASAAIANPARVAYFMELNDGVSTKWVWASMDNFASSLAQLGLPNPTTNPVNWDQNVTNLNVYASANAGLVNGTSVGVGRLEMWRFDYGPENVNAVPNANGGTFDFGDRNALGNNYGSFQVHNVTAGQTLLAYNNWGSDGGNGDIGIGNRATADPDWTFAHNTAAYTVKRIYILVPNGGAITQAATVSLNAAGTVTVLPSQVTTTLTDNCTSTAALTVVVTPNTFTCANLGPNTVTVTASDANGNTTTASAVVTVTVPPTPTTTWTGASSTDWTDCANWSFGKVPDAATSVIIPTTMPRYPSLPAGTFPVLDLTINSGGSLSAVSGTTLQINGNFANSGTATLPGIVAFVGSTASQTLGGSTATAFSTVTVNKASGTVQLGRDLAIGTALTLTSGTLTTTASYQVAIGSAATISESDASYVIGKVTLTRTLTPGTAELFGGLGLRLTPATGSVAPGSTTVTRTTGTALAGVNSSVSIRRYFAIQPIVNAGLNVTMAFSYLPHELNFTLGTLGLFKSVSGGMPWIPQYYITVAGTTVTKTGITDFSTWTLGNAAAPLPVELSAFTATPQGAAVRLAWATASEKNSAHFEVERSPNGTSFDRIGTVAAAGNSSSARTYSLTDALLPAGVSLVYYRLRQVDQDGSFAYSPVRSIVLNGKASLALFPNPAHGGGATLTGAQPGTVVTVFDALGRVVTSAPADATGTATLVLPTGLASGVYVVRAGATALRLTVE